MKFENPIINISMFEVENVVTESNPDTLNSATTAKSYASNLKEGNAVAAVLEFSF